MKASSIQDYERLAADWVSAHEARDAAALDRLNLHYGRACTFEDLSADVWRRVYAVRQRAFKEPGNHLEPDEARMLVANDAGFGSWAALVASLVGATHRPVPAYDLDAKESRITPRRRLTDAEWDEVIAVMKEGRIKALDANGQMTDRVMAHVAALDHVTTLRLGGSRELGDDGLLHLSRMPQLEHLDLSEYPGGRLTDRGLAVLRHLRQLRVFEMTWQSGISDAGIANLASCHRLERVNLMGSPTGDGAIAALRGKPNLQDFSSGRLVTDAGLQGLQEFPRLKTWHGEDVSSGSHEDLAGGARLVIDGPFTDNGLAGLSRLEGLADLDLFWHVTRITSEGFAHLAQVPHLGALGCDGTLSDDVAMAHIAAIPQLRRLRAQESVASDAGFTALSRSRTLEFLWGRVCPNFGSRGFLALSKMPTLRGLGIGCQNVDDGALARLPDFPSLRELTPIGVSDEGFRHVGRCERLERLTCMYCRDTTDVATAHISGLPLKYYYAGLTQIGDRSLEILGRMSTLEQVEFYECKSITDRGLVFLAGLPHLREVHLNGLPGVTLPGTSVFPSHVRVRYSL